MVQFDIDVGVEHTGHFPCSEMAFLMHLKTIQCKTRHLRKDTDDSQKRWPQEVTVMFCGNSWHIGHTSPMSSGSFSSHGPSNCFAGHPEYTAPESATSPEVSKVCSHNMLLSSIEAPDSRREPVRIAHLEFISSCM